MRALTVRLLLGLALATCASAGMPFPDDSLGQLEAVLDHCAQVNPQAASQYQQAKKMLVEQATAAELAKIRAGKPYQEAYERASAELGQQSAEQLSKTCAASIGAEG